MKKILIMILVAAAFIFFFTRCNKELSAQKDCGVITSIGVHSAIITYPDGHTKLGPKENVHVGQKICN